MTKKLISMATAASMLATGAHAKLEQPYAETVKVWGKPFSTLPDGRTYFHKGQWILVEVYDASGNAILTFYYKRRNFITESEAGDLDDKNLPDEERRDPVNQWLTVDSGCATIVQRNSLDNKYVFMYGTCPFGQETTYMRAYATYAGAEFIIKKGWGGDVPTDKQVSSCPETRI
jgi:hypothetical protein